MAVNFLNIMGHQTFLYLDDRIMVFNMPTVKVATGSNFLGAAQLILLLTLLGGYINLDKSILQPTSRIDYLGFTIDSILETVEVPKEKHAKTMAKMDELWDEKGRIDIKKLESVRGRLMSWTLCVPLSKLFIREQNSVIARAYKFDKWKWTKAELKGSNLLEELAIWREMKLEQLKRNWRSDRHEVFNVDTQRTWAVYTDASSFGLGGRVYARDNETAIATLNQPDESDLVDEAFFQVSTDGVNDDPIHVKEMEVVWKTLVALQHKVKNQHLTLYIDNMRRVALK